MFFYTGKNPMSIDQIRESAPAVFSQHASSLVSNRYSFISTERVLKALLNSGFQVFSARQNGSRSKNKKDVVRHMLRFRKKDIDLVQGELIPEIVLNTSHDGTCAFRFDLGFFRILCSNGLVAPSSFHGSHSVRHQGYSDSDVIDVAHEILSLCPKIDQNVGEMKRLILSEKERELFAETALDFKYGSESFESNELEENPTNEKEEIPKIDPRAVLKPLRYGDNSKDLFSTFNVIQENVIRGGVRYMSKDKNGSIVRRKTREIKSINEDLRLNKALKFWN